MFDNLEQVLVKIKKCSHLYLFLDYDGTLVGIKKRPEDAKPSKKTKLILSKLISNNRLTTVLVSGRPVMQLVGFLHGIETGKLNMVGSHGAEIKIDGRELEIIEAARGHIKHIGSIKKELEKITGHKSCFYLEDKKVSLALHYRNCPPKDLEKLGKIRNFLKVHTGRLGLDVIEGKKVIEVKASSINKGMALKNLKNKWSSSRSGLSLCIGDDVTDEYMFKANSGGLNLKVAKNSNVDSQARYYLKGIGQVQKFLMRVNQEVR
ncbi:MAG: trehalose-phosphatase [Actinomycetota bacterium]|nr:trehalose-phosphatase [Actinomycetota bacterium]